MYSLTWPYSNTTDDHNYNAYYNNREDDDAPSDYFMMRQMRNNSMITATYLKFEPPNKYDKLFFINLDENVLLDTTTPSPLISYGEAYTIEVTMKLFDLSNVKYEGLANYDENYFKKSRVFFSLGQNTFGVGGHVITVGTNADPEYPEHKNIPVLGMIVGDTSIKSDPTTDALSIIDGETYKFKLIYNPLASLENKLLLFMSLVNVNTDGAISSSSSSSSNNDTVIQSTGMKLSSTYNYDVIKPRLYFFTSGWTNEFGWSDTFDYAYAELHVNDDDDHFKPLIVSQGIIYDDDYVLDQLRNLSYDVPNIRYTGDRQFEVTTTESIGFMSYQSGSHLVIYTD